MRRPGRIHEPRRGPARLRSGLPKGAGLLALIGPVLVAAGTSRADDDGPVLSPPVEAEVANAPPRPAPAPRPPIVAAPIPARLAPPVAPPTLEDDRAVLAIPGLTRRATVPRGHVEEVGGRAPTRPLPPAAPASTSPSRPDSEPTLDGPIEMDDVPLPVPLVPDEAGEGPAEALPRLDSLPRTARDPLDPPGDRVAPRPGPGEANRAVRSSPSRPGAAPPGRRGRWFGLLGSAPSVPVASAASPGAADRPGDGDHRVDPARPPGRPGADALESRIEKQARLAVAGRARSVDVRLDEKTAVIQVRGVWFLQKRGVRKSLESLPGLSGLRSRIEFVD